MISLKKTTAIIPIILLIGAISYYNSSAKNNDSVSEIIILHDNDLHFTFENWEKVKKYKDKYSLIYGHENVFLFNAGDTFHYHGTSVMDMETRERKAREMIDKMNIIGYNAMTLGNHEFDYGYKKFFPDHLNGFHELGDVYSKALENADFPLLSANIDVGTRDFIKPEPYTTFDISGIKMTVVGLTDITFLSWCDRIITHDPVDTALKYLHLKEKADIFVALSHMGIHRDIFLAQIMEKDTGFDIIIGGHTHSQIQGTVNSVFISQAGAYNRYLSKIKISITQNGISEINGKIFCLETDSVVESHSYSIH